ncbi:hypothetical protein Btru_008082 [Bulinus truncatus]|nr:hypothetical protein Btru_008082 [Bulinus truncatus]
MYLNITFSRWGRTPTVVLEQSYLNKMTDGVKPFISLASCRSPSTSQVSDSGPHVFISYQWDARTKVDEIQRALRQAGYTSWADISMATDLPYNSGGGGGGTSAHSSALSRSNTVMESLQSQIYRTMKSCQAVVCCLTPKYIQSDNCTKDLSLAYALQKPVVPVLLRYVPTESVRRTMGPFLLNLSCIDLSNERLYKQNITNLIQKIQKIV